jgi:hypothetical protein
MMRVHYRKFFLAQIWRSAEGKFSFWDQKWIIYYCKMPYHTDQVVVKKVFCLFFGGLYWPLLAYVPHFVFLINLDQINVLSYKIKGCGEGAEMEKNLPQCF